LIIDVENKVILESHIQCAANEMPIQIEEDEVYFGPLLEEMCTKLERDKEGWYAVARISRWRYRDKAGVLRYHTHRKYLPHPSKHVAIRGAREDKYTIVDITNQDKPNGRARILEELELSRALFEVRLLHHLSTP
jgi:DEAD/DEAH box helicase domain-containing protein